MSLVVGEDVPAQQVEDLIRRAGGRLLVGVTLFDVYRGEPIPAGKKSLAYSLTYRHAERTLTDKEVAKVHTKIAKRLELSYGNRPSPHPWPLPSPNCGRGEGMAA